MSFVNEMIPEDVKKNFDFSIFKRRIGDGPLELYKWTIDRERDAFLLHLGGGGGPMGAERASYWALWWKGDVIYFEGYENVSKDDKGQVLTWEQPSVYIPQHLESRRAEFIQLLREALDVMGWTYRRTYIYAVNIDLQ